MIRRKSVIALESLLEGQPIKFPDSPNEYFYLNGVFGILATSYNTKTKETEQVIL
jgi:hypothetical protein